jgi:hypothetical protein
VGSERSGWMYSVARCLGWGRDGWRMAGVGCSRSLGSTREEWRWWSRGAAEGAGNEVGGAPDVGVELRAVTAQWRQRRRRKKGSSRGGALLLKAARGGGRGRRKRWAGRRAGETAKPWVDKAVAAV